MKFLDFKNFNDFKGKIGIDGKEAIMLMIDEIEKKERTIKSRISRSKKSKTEDDAF